MSIFRMFYSYFTRGCKDINEKDGATTGDHKLTESDIFSVFSHGFHNQVEKLLKMQQVDPETRRLHDGFTPLMAAAYYNNDDAASLLIDKAGVDLSAQNDFGQNALMITVACGTIDVFNIIMNKLSNMPREEAYNILRQVDGDGFNVLMLSVREGGNRTGYITGRLLETGAFDINAFSPTGDTCLMLAAKENRFEDLSELVYHQDIDPNICHPSNGKTAFQIALENASYEATTYLMCHPAIFVSLEPCPPVSVFPPIKAKKYEMATFLVTQYLSDPQAAKAFLSSLLPYFYNSINPKTE